MIINGPLGAPEQPASETAKSSAAAIGRRLGFDRVSARMSYLIAIGAVIILGAVVGLVWQERNLSFRTAFRKVRRAR
jgi:uncharacterized protein HemX